MRRLLAVAAVSLLGFPAPAPAAAQTSDPGGTSVAVVDLGGVIVGDLAQDSLGSARAQATTAGETPASFARLTLPGGESLEATSDGETQLPPQEVSLGGLGTVRVAGISADADDVTARAVVELLEAELTPLGLQLGTQGGGLGVGADGAGTESVNGVAVADLSVGLDDVLGDELLAELPLSVLLDLAGLLGLDLSELGLGSLEELVEELELGATLAAQVETARTALAEATTAVSAAQDDVDDAIAGAAATTAAVAAKEQEIATLQAQIGNLGCAAVPALCAQLQDAQAELQILAADQATAQDAVDTATTVLTSAQETLQAAQAAFDDLVAEVDALLQRLSELLSALDGLDLAALLDQLRAGLAGVELLGVDELSLEAATFATATQSGALVDCTVGGVRVAGQPVDVDVCEDLPAVLFELVDEIFAVLEALPVASLPANAVTVTPPSVTVTEPDAVRNGARVAEARVEGLGVDVAPLELTDLVTDGLLGPLTAFLDDVLADLVDVSTVAGLDLTAGLQDLIDEIGILPTGDLAGLSTLSVSLVPAEVLAASEFAPARGDDGTTPPPGTGGGPGGGGRPTLPATGGGIGAGVLLLGAGAMIAVWLRSRRA